MEFKKPVFASGRFKAVIDPAVYLAKVDTPSAKSLAKFVADVIDQTEPQKTDQIVMTAMTIASISTPSEIQKIGEQYLQNVQPTINAAGLDAGIQLAKDVVSQEIAQKDLLVAAINAGVSRQEGYAIKESLEPVKVIDRIVLVPDGFKKSENLRQLSKDLNSNGFIVRPTIEHVFATGIDNEKRGAKSAAQFERQVLKHVPLEYAKAYRSMHAHGSDHKLGLIDARDYFRMLVRDAFEAPKAEERVPIADALRMLDPVLKKNTEILAKVKQTVEPKPIVPMVLEESQRGRPTQERGKEEERQPEVVEEMNPPQGSAPLKRHIDSVFNTEDRKDVEIIDIESKDKPPDKKGESQPTRRYSLRPKVRNREDTN